MPIKKDLNSDVRQDGNHVATGFVVTGSRQNNVVASDRLLTVKQASEKTQISVRQLRRLIKAGEMPVKRFGRVIRIHPKHLGL